MYSNIYTRAGLIMFAFILIISLVSAAPISITSTLYPRVRHQLPFLVTLVSILIISCRSTHQTMDLHSRCRFRRSGKLGTSMTVKYSIFSGMHWATLERWSPSRSLERGLRLISLIDKSSFQRELF